MSFDDRVRGVLEQMLGDPVSLPRAFKAAIPRYVEMEGQFPRSSITGLYTTATSSSNFGERVQGRPVILRVGSTPYEFVQFQYDSTYGKWVSAQVWNVNQIDTANIGATTYTQVNPILFPPFFIQNFKSIYDAGCRPQFTSGVKLGKGTANTINFAVGISEVAEGDTALNSLYSGAAEITSTDAAATYRFFNGWNQPTITAPTEAHAYLLPLAKVDTGSGQLTSSGFIQLRFVVD